MDKSPTSNRFRYRRTYRRNLPHIQPIGADLFITFRLAGSLPQNVLAWMAEERRWREQIENGISKPNLTVTGRARRHFAMLEKYLDNCTAGPTWLAQSSVADLVAEALHHRDGSVYRLDAFSLMPNHVHSVFKPLTRDGHTYSLSSIMHSLKRNTARQANLVLDRSGSFWAHESFDHYVRDEEELRRIVRYVLGNPVKAGLVECWQDWPWNYVRPELLNDAS